MAIRKLFKKPNLPRKKAENKIKEKAIRISLLVVMSFLLIWGGHFLFLRLGEPAPKPETSDSVEQQTGSRSGGAPAELAKAAKNTVKYIHRTEQIHGYKQEINLLEIDPAVPGIRIQPVLSNDIIYGFEPLSDMASRKNAYAAVTGGFFSRYGLPAGIVVINGNLISAATGKYPVFIVENGKASLRDLKSTIKIEYTRITNAPADRAISSTATTSIAMPTSGNLTADCYNAPAAAKSVAVYTSYYGKTNRAKKPNISLTVEEGKVSKIAHYPDEADIPENGILITFFDLEKYSLESMPVRKGDMISIRHSPELAAGVDAYECGTWLVRGGKSIVPQKDAWIGVLTNRDPRTAIGVKADGRVVLFTVDGRQPGYSAGFTGQELAEYLVGCGVTDAAMLDGGASAEMIYKGKLVSRPSYKGEERTLGGGILVITGSAE